MKYFDMYNDKENPRAQQKRISGQRCEALKPLKVRIADQCVMDANKITNMLTSLEKLGYMFELAKDNYNFNIVPQNKTERRAM